MRIRKQSAKILGVGAASLFPSPPPTSAAQIWSPWTRNADAVPLCELNRSTWDAMSSEPPNHLLYANLKQVEMETEGEGILENGIKCVGKSIHSSWPSNEDLEGKGIEKNVKKKGRKRRTNKQDRNGSEVCDASGEATVVTARCKKSDGKAWKCSRPAEHPHSLCGYHLGLIRSNNRGCKPVNKAPVPRAPVRKRMKAVADNGAPAEAGAQSNYVFYYNGFGPWRRKRRGGDGDGPTKEEENEDESKENSEPIEESGDAPLPWVQNGDTNEGHGNAGDERGGKDVTDGDQKDESDEGQQMGNKKSNNPGRGKRRRKRIKARSLKSFL